MSFNYFNNKSLIGNTTDPVSGILTLSNAKSLTKGVSLISVTRTDATLVTYATGATSIVTISGAGLDSITNSLILQYNSIGSNNLVYSATISSESYDPGTLTVNNNQLFSISGINGASGSTALTPGLNTIVIKYVKDGSITEGDDQFAVSWSFT